MKVCRAILTIAAELVTLAIAQSDRQVEVASNDIPPDARIVSGHWDAAGQRFVLVLESASFPETTEPDPLPRLVGPHFRAYDRPTGGNRGREFI